MVDKLRSVWFTSLEMIDELKFYWIFNRATRLLYDDKPLIDLEHEFRELKNSSFWSEYVDGKV